MPFVKNPANQVVLALEPEVRGLLDKGWKVLDSAEEAAHRYFLATQLELTTFAEQEKARMEAGLYGTLYPNANGEEKKIEEAPADAPLNHDPVGTTKIEVKDQESNGDATGQPTTVSTDPTTQSAQNDVNGGSDAA